MDSPNFKYVISVSKSVSIIHLVSNIIVDLKSKLKLDFIGFVFIIAKAVKTFDNKWAPLLNVHPFKHADCYGRTEHELRHGLSLKSSPIWDSNKF